MRLQNFNLHFFWFYYIIKDGVNEVIEDEDGVEVFYYIHEVFYVIESRSKLKWSNSHGRD